MMSKIFPSDTLFRVLQLSSSGTSPVKPEACGSEATLPRIALIAAGKEIVGGHEVQARAVVEGLRQTGYEVSFIPINPPFPPRLQWLRRVRYLRTVLNQILYLFSLASLRHVDVVHVFSASYWSFLLAPVPAMAVGRFFDKRIVLHYHSGEAEDHLKNWGLLVHPWLRLAHEIAVPSEFLLEVFAQYGYNTRVIRNVVDTSRFGFRERKPLLPRLLSVRNFERHYRVDMTLQAFAYIKDRYPEATLTLAGTGSEEESLRLLAATISIDGIHFAGCVGPDHIAGLYDDCDIFLNSSVVDNQPVSILEAFAAGLPVITTATGDIAAMVCDGETGCIVPPTDPAAMADAVISMLENPQLAAQMARRAREDVECYTWPQVRSEWMSVYGINPRVSAELNTTLLKK
jgi:glycosyltransferase involved in cell wall biosynthesis